MHRLTVLMGAVILASAMRAGAQDFPEAPADAVAAETAGLKRAGVEELKALFAGLREERNSRGESYLARYRPDGGVELTAGSSPIDRGTFAITAQGGGSVCLMLEKQMNQRLCSIWFAASDGLHLFGYNPSDGKLRTVSRASSR